MKEQDAASPESPVEDHPKSKEAVVQEEAEKGAIQDMASPANQVEDCPKSKEAAV